MRHENGGVEEQKEVICGGDEDQNNSASTDIICSKDTLEKHPQTRNLEEMFLFVDGD